MKGLPVYEQRGGPERLVRHEAEARGLARHQPENMKIFGEDVMNTTKA